MWMRHAIVDVVTEAPIVESRWTPALWILVIVIEAVGIVHILTIWLHHAVIQRVQWVTNITALTLRTCNNKIRLDEYVF